MILNIFQYDNATGRVELNKPEILLIKEFSELMKDERNICDEDKTGKYKLRAFREFTYIYLAICWTSPYESYSNQERHELALADARMSDEEFNDPDFRAACRKFRDMQNEIRSIKLLRAAQETVDKFIDYYHNLDPEERDPITGKPVFKIKEITDGLSSLNKLEDDLKAFEIKVKKEVAETSSLRGGYEDGYTPKF